MKQLLAVALLTLGLAVNGGPNGRAAEPLDGNDLENAYGWSYTVKMGGRAEDAVFSDRAAGLAGNLCEMAIAGTSGNFGFGSPAAGIRNAAALAAAERNRDWMDAPSVSTADTLGIWLETIRDDAVDLFSAAGTNASRVAPSDSIGAMYFFDGSPSFDEYVDGAVFFRVVGVDKPLSGQPLPGVIGSLILGGGALLWLRRKHRK